MRELDCRWVRPDPTTVPGAEDESLGGRIPGVVCETSGYDTCVVGETWRTGLLDDKCVTLMARGCGGLCGGFVVEELFRRPSSKEDLRLETLGEDISRPTLA